MLGRQTELAEAVGAPGQVVPRRLAGLSASRITRSETNLDVSVEESVPLRADEIGLVRVDKFGPADEDVVQEAEELNHVPAPTSEVGALRVSVAGDFHLVIAKLTRKRSLQNKYLLSLCGLRVLRATGRPIT